MKVLQTEHKGIVYSFEYMEQSDIILVVKDNIPVYQIKINWSSTVDEQFICNCPGSVWHQKCWHISVIPQLIAQPSINEPWCEWAEEASRGRMKNEELHN